jgi:hypothetical protein
MPFTKESSESTTRKRYSNRKPGDVTVKLGQSRKATSFPTGQLVPLEHAQPSQGRKHKKPLKGTSGLDGLQS